MRGSGRGEGSAPTGPPVGKKSESALLYFWRSEGYGSGVWDRGREEKGGDRCSCAPLLLRTASTRRIGALLTSYPGRVLPLIESINPLSPSLQWGKIRKKAPRSIFIRRVQARLSRQDQRHARGKGERRRGARSGIAAADGFGEGPRGGIWRRIRAP